MKAARMEAFTDGVIAIIITITVLEMKVPPGLTTGALRQVLPVLAAYVLSFVNVGLFWANHHHLLHATEKIDGRVLWANLFMLFWLSLVPWVIRWLDEMSFAALPTAAYGVVLGLAGVGYNLTQSAIIRVNGGDSPVARAVGGDRKGKMSILLYAIGVPTAFFAPWLAIAIYVAISLMWIVPDRRIEQELTD